MRLGLFFCNFATVMDTIFHHRVSIGEVCGIILGAAAALSFLWMRSTVSVILGLAFFILTVLAIEQAIHTTYVVSDDGWLHISKGRFQSKTDISVNEIKKISKVRLMGGLVHYLLIEYGPTGHLAHIQPIGEDRMMRMIDKRREK